MSFAPEYCESRIYLKFDTLARAFAAQYFVDHSSHEATKLPIYANG